MKAIFLVILAVLLSFAACVSDKPIPNVPPVEAQANSNSNTAQANSNSMAIPVPAPTSSPEKGQWNECRICDFDYAAYKGELNKDEINGLLLALNDEYLATATYDQVNKDFNDPRPFVNIVRAEQQHAERLKQVFKTYNVPIPDNPWTGKAQKFASVTEACKASVDGEIVNRDLYKKLFDSTKRGDILMVYRALQRASEQNHLPAFERCAAGGGGRGMGPGGGPGRGRGRPW